MREYHEKHVMNEKKNKISVQNASGNRGRLTFANCSGVLYLPDSSLVCLFEHIKIVLRCDDSVRLKGMFPIEITSCYSIEEYLNGAEIHRVRDDLRIVEQTKKLPVDRLQKRNCFSLGL